MSRRLRGCGVGALPALLLLLLLGPPATPGRERAGSGKPGWGRPPAQGCAPARRGHVEGRGDRRLRAPRPGSPGLSRQGASGRAFHSTFSPIFEAKGRSRGLQCGLGVESFTAISRNASAPRGKLCARSSAGSPPGGWGGPGKTTGLYPPIKAGYMGGGW